MIVSVGEDCAKASVKPRDWSLITGGGGGGAHNGRGGGGM